MVIIEVEPLTPGLFGRELYRLRTGRKVGQAFVATRAKLAPSYYSEIENSKRRPPPSSTVARLADALCVTDKERETLLLLADEERPVKIRINGSTAPRLASALIRIAASTDDSPEIHLRRIEQLLREVEM